MLLEQGHIWANSPLRQLCERSPRYPTGQGWRLGRRVDVPADRKRGERFIGFNPGLTRNVAQWICPFCRIRSWTQRATLGKGPLRSLLHLKKSTIPSSRCAPLTHARSPGIGAPSEPACRYQNHSLMLPSERYKEHLKMKAGEQKWREERDAVFRYRKRMTVLERKHPEADVSV